MIETWYGERAVLCSIDSRYDVDVLGVCQDLIDRGAESFTISIDNEITFRVPNVMSKNFRGAMDLFARSIEDGFCVTVTSHSANWQDPWANIGRMGHGLSTTISSITCSPIFLAMDK